MTSSHNLAMCLYFRAPSEFSAYIWFTVFLGWVWEWISRKVRNILHLCILKLLASSSFMILFMSFRGGMILFNAGRCFQSENSKTVPQNDLFDEHCIDYGLGNIVYFCYILRLVALRVSWTGLRVVILLRLLFWYDWYVLRWKMPVNVLCWWCFLDSWATTYGWPFLHALFLSFYFICQILLYGSPLRGAFFSAHGFTVGRWPGSFLWITFLLSINFM